MELKDTIALMQSDDYKDQRKTYDRYKDRG